MERHKTAFTIVYVEAQNFGEILSTIFKTMIDSRSSNAFAMIAMSSAYYNARTDSGILAAIDLGSLVFIAWTICCSISATMMKSICERKMP